MYIVITDKGFLTTKDKSDLELTDNIISEGTEDCCYDTIHGKGRKLKIGDKSDD